MGNPDQSGNVEGVAQEVIADKAKEEGGVGRDGKPTATTVDQTTTLQTSRKYSLWLYGGGCFLIIVALVLVTVGLLDYLFGANFTDELISGYFHDVGLPVPSEFYIGSQPPAPVAPIVKPEDTLIPIAKPEDTLVPIAGLGDYAVTVNDVSWSDRPNQDLGQDYGLMDGLKLTVTVAPSHSIVFQAPVPWWVPVSGELAADGTFDATGAAKAWGIDGLGAEFKGALTPSGLLSGEYYVGVKVTTETGVTGRVLPSGRPITFHVDGQLQGAAAQSVANPPSTQVSSVTSGVANPPSAVPSGIDPRLQTFIEQFVPALRNNDTAFLFQHLHPAVLNLYGAAQCQSYVNQRSMDPTYNIVVLDAQGPAPWTWVASGITTQVQDVYTLDANVTVQGQTAKRQVHFGLVGDTIYWFAECGNPLATPIPTQ